MGWGPSPHPDIVDPFRKTTTYSPFAPLEKVRPTIRPAGDRIGPTPARFPHWKPEISKPQIGRVVPEGLIGCGRSTSEIGNLETARFPHWKPEISKPQIGRVVPEAFIGYGRF